MNQGIHVLRKLKKQFFLFQILCSQWRNAAFMGKDSAVYARLYLIEKKISELLGTEDGPQEVQGKLKWYYRVASFLGYTFVTQWLMRKKRRQIRHLKRAGGEQIQESAQQISTLLSEEDRLIRELEEPRLAFVGAIILGMNDALVELTGSVAGFTLSISNTKLIALAGLITGTAAALSMAASEFMAERSDKKIGKAVTAALYTGLSYFGTVIMLILPYMILPGDQYMPALIITLVIAALIIAIFSYYMSVAKEISFRSHFLEMTVVSFGVALFSFIIGFVVKNVFGLQI